MDIGYVYILLLVNNQYYVGSTIDLERRITEHNSGYTSSVRYKLPAKLIFHQQCETIKKARQIEYYIKKQKSRNFIEKIISDGFIKID